MSTVQSSTAASVTGSAAPAAATSGADIQDRFLKLLVTQMKNQDPLNPMDNAEITSQLAQISTVNGIQQLNTTMQSLSSSFLSAQSLQSAALIGHTVLTGGNNLNIADGMPAYGGKLTDAQIWQLAAFVKALDTRGEATVQGLDLTVAR